MGLFKQMRQMKEVVAETPDMISNAQAMQESQSAAAQAAAARATAASSIGGPSGEPIAGVSLEFYAEVSRELMARGGDQAAAPVIARERGVDHHRWDAAVAGWNERMRTDPAMAARFNELWRAIG